MTVRELIKGSLRLIGAIATGETPSAAEQADALSVLNDMLESWSIEGFLVYKITRESFALTSGQQVRTIGTGGNFSTSRPAKIVNASIEEGDIEYPMQIITADEWAGILNKDQTANIPQVIYPEGTYPLETLNLWPIPSAANNIIIYSQKPLTSFANVTESISLPPGYLKAVRYNLALELAPEYGKEPNPLVVAGAQESLVDLKRQNTKPVYTVSDAFGLANNKPFNIVTGE